MIRLRVLGSLSLDSTADPVIGDLLAQPKAMALLSYLLLARPRGSHQRDRLVGLLWPEVDQEDARASLRKTIHRLRQSLGEEVIVSQGKESVGIAPNAIDCDAIRFSEAVESQSLREALDLYAGDLLPGFFVPDASSAFEDWLEMEREFYRERVVASAWKLVEIFAAQRELTNATQLARLVARLAPSDERMLRRVVTMLARLEDRAGAVAVYTRFAARLWKEFETKPSPETLRLIEAVQRGDAI